MRSSVARLRDREARAGGAFVRVTMRLFYALWPDVPVQQALAQWAHGCHRVCGGRSLAAEKLHLTVAFLGEVADSRYPSLVDIGASIGVAGFELVLDRVAYWRHSRIVYAAPSAIPAALLTLERALARRLQAAGWPAEERPFAPHVTLLRDAKRSPHGIAFPALAFRSAALSLVETIRCDGKLAYQVRESWTLAG